MRKLLSSTFVLLCIVTSLGCRGDGSQRWGGSPWGQGSIDRQKARATVFDPYPLNDIGPEVVGGRPRGFLDPLSQTQRNELSAATLRNLQGF